METEGGLAWFSLGRAFREMEQYDDALESFRQALRLAPANPEAWHGAGVVFIHLGRDEEAALAFRRALILDPAKSSSRFNLATLIRSDSPAEAALHLSVLWRQDPDFAALLEAQLGNRSGA